jgi:SAM-dependent methyltransferase
MTLEPVVDLGAQPLANGFIPPESVPFERRYPLQPVVCTNCWLTQLRHVVRAQVIFDEYSYLSSTSAPLVRHYAELVNGLTGAIGLHPTDVVVDIGCNDGILLKSYDPGLVRVGVEPSQIAELARAAGLAVVKAYFDETVAREIVARYGRARVVTATNVFAHVDDIGAFARAIPLLLADDGLFVLEVSYLPDLIAGRLFDTIYHEHLCYCALTPLVPVLDRCGMTVVDAERVSLGASGPAVRVTARLPAGASPSQRVEQVLAFERAWGVSSLVTYARFRMRVAEIRDRLREMLYRLRDAGNRIAAFGAPAKGNTLLNYVGLDRSVIEFVADDTPLKRGKLTPGTHIPVVGDDHLLDQMPPYALLLAWNYLEHFLANSEYVHRGGRFVVPLPDPRIVP